jgi:hypothetical protein
MGRVRRFVDTGTSLELTATLSLEGLGGTSSRLATEDELVMLDTTAITRVTFAQGQGLTAWPPFRLPSRYRGAFGSDFIEGLLLRSGERLLWVSASLTPAVEFVSSVCPLRLGAEGGFVADELPCQTVPGMPIGSEPGVLWLRTGELRPGGSDPRFTMDVLTRWVVRDGRLVEAGALRLRDAASTLRGRLSYGPVVPTLASGLTPYAALPGWRPAPGELEPGLELELFPASLGPRANPRFFWNNLSGTVRVFAR